MTVRITSWRPGTSRTGEKDKLSTGFNLTPYRVVSKHGRRRPIHPQHYACQATATEQ